MQNTLSTFFKTVSPYVKTLFWSLVLTFLFLFKAQANFEVIDGWNPISTEKISIKTGANKNLDYWAYQSKSIPAHWGIKSTQGYPDQCESSLSTVQIGAYNGLRIADGVYLVMYSSQITSTSRVGRDILRTRVVNFNAAGYSYDQPAPNGGSWCFGDLYFNGYWNMTDVRQANGTLRFGIYVVPGTPESTVTLPSLYFSKMDSTSALIYSELSISGSVLNVNPTKCTLNIPAAISFGDISNSSAKKVQSNASVSCNSPMQNSLLNVMYRVSSTRTNSSKTTLTMVNNSGGQKVADIRGFIGDEGINSLGCVDQSSSLFFDGTSALLSSKVSNNGTSTIPITWVLCPDPKAQPGPASSSITLDISW